MVKKVITSALLLIWVNSLALAGYRMLEPKAAESIIENKTALASVDAQGRNVETDETAQTFAIDTPEEEYHYYYFCTAENADCTYINDYVLKPLAEVLEVDTIDVLEYVDMGTLSTEWTPQRIKNQWGFDDYPAFVATMTDTEGNRSILSVMQWNANDPIDQDALKNWMIENEIWTGPIEEQGELIEQPQE